MASATTTNQSTVSGRIWTNESAPLTLDRLGPEPDVRGVELDSGPLKVSSQGDGVSPEQSGQLRERKLHVGTPDLRLFHSRSRSHNMLLRQLSYPIKTQLKAVKASYRGISCLSLCLSGFRLPVI